jgi:hypothetical protein
VGSIPITRSIENADVEGIELDRILKGAHVAQSVEHVLGKDEVTGSIPVVGSMRDIFRGLPLWPKRSLNGPSRT